MICNRSSLAVAVVGTGLLMFFIAPCISEASAAPIYMQTNLVSNVSGLAAVTDPHLKNPWGMSFAPTSPFWISNQGTDTSTLYNGAGGIVPLVVSIPPIGAPRGPTGQVFNGTSSFVLPNGSPAFFLFATRDGQIQGWNPNAIPITTAVNVATTAGASYTGLANGSVGSSNYLYAADTNGHINVFDGSFTNVTNTTFAGKFVDPNALPGFTPFNIQNINGNLFVTYADVPGLVALPGGFVDEFDTSGNLIARIATGGDLFAPWGITMAPSHGFGAFSGDLLIGQFGSGVILVYDPSTDQFLGMLSDKSGPITNSGLWALDFRTGGAHDDLNALYFTAGINGQRNGLFGKINLAPEPATLSLAFGALGVLGGGSLIRRRRRA